MNLRTIVRAVAPQRLRACVRLVRSGALKSSSAVVSFSQEGEDLFLSRFFDGQESGFYVDVGAHHPIRFSNTHLLYTRGWRGMNIDATPGSMAAFARARPRDINLELAVSSSKGTRAFFVFDEPALNSLDQELSESRDSGSKYSVARTIDVSTVPLSDILSENLPSAVDRIDLMTIDVEGHDLEVLQSNDWERFRPRMLLIELLESSLAQLDEREEIAFLREWGYRPYAKLVNTVALRDIR